MSQWRQPFSWRSTVDRASAPTSTPPRTLHNPAELKEAERLLAAALEILRQGEDLLRVLPRERYAQRVCAGSNSSIGDQYGLCLDQFRSLVRTLEGPGTGAEQGEPQSKLESERDAALVLTRRTRERLQQLTAGDLIRPLQGAGNGEGELGERSDAWGTLRQKLAEATAGAVRQFGVISRIAQDLEVTLPLHFGSAPAREESSQNLHSTA